MPAVSLEAYRRWTLAGSVAGAALFGSGLVALVQLGQPGPAAALMVAGAGAALATAGLRIEGAPSSLPPSVLLYVRAECALCEEARALLDALRRELPFDVWEVDVASDPALEQAYGASVPVATARGEELFRLRFDEARVRAALATR